MKLRQIIAEIETDTVRNFRIEQMRKKFNLKDNTVWISAYHGTSEKNVKGIERSGFKSGSWFAIDQETATKYSKQAGGKPFIMSVRLYIGSLLPNGDYMTSQEPLISTSVGYVPKDLTRKVYDME